MKLSELRPCDSCHQPTIRTGSYLLRLSLVVVNQQAAREVLGLGMMFGGRLGLAEAMAPDAEPIKVAGDADPALWTEALICQACALEQPLDLGRILSELGERETGA